MGYQEFEQAVKSCGGKPGLLTIGSCDAICGALAEGEEILVASECVDSKGMGAIVITSRNFYASKKTGMFGSKETTIPLERIVSFSVKKGFGSNDLIIAEGTSQHIFPQVINYEGIITALKKAQSVDIKTEPPKPATDKFDEIRKYKALLDEGILTQEEFEKKRQNYWPEAQ